jgi:molybdenum cofactor guanylyltransferase
MITKENLTVILLAGGKSSRMGEDKAFLMLRGKTFCEHIIAAALPCCKELIIVANDQRYTQFGFKVVTDNYKNAGPLAGLEAGLIASESELNLILSCDNPLISTALLNNISENNKTGFISVFTNNKQIQPFPGLYPSKLIGALSKALDKGDNKLIRFIKDQKHQQLMLPDSLKHQIININHKTDYKKLKNDYKD